MKRNLSTILLVVVFLAGLSLLLYPTISDRWNAVHASQAVASYVDQVQELDQSEYDQIWNAATAYNQALGSGSSTLEDQKAQYEKLLDITGTGIMGYIEVPNIRVSLPIYHGTDESILQVAVGHLAWSSLPVGGEGTHCVLTGHRGLPSAKLFTNLDQMAEGDTFVIRVLNEVLTYEVDQIHIVEPEDVSDLQIEAGKDLCTLVTCTPYGVNSHRLLIRGHRVENAPEAVRLTSEAVQIEPLLVAPIVACPILLALLIVLLVSKRNKNGGSHHGKKK